MSKDKSERKFRTVKMDISSIISGNNIAWGDAVKKVPYGYRNKRDTYRRSLLDPMY